MFAFSHSSVQTYSLHTTKVQITKLCTEICTDLSRNFFASLISYHVHMVDFFLNICLAGFGECNVTFML